MARTKISPDIVFKVVSLLNQGHTQTKIVKEVGVSNGTVNAIKQERQRILSEAKKGNIVKANEISGNTAQWERRKSRYSEVIQKAIGKDVTNIAPVKEEKPEMKVVQPKEVKLEIVPPSDSFTLVYKGLTFNIEEKITSITLSKNKLIID